MKFLAAVTLFVVAAAAATTRPPGYTCDPPAFKKCLSDANNKLNNDCKHNGPGCMCASLRDTVHCYDSCNNPVGQLVAEFQLQKANCTSDEPAPSFVI